MAVKTPGFALYLGPNMRGAPDAIRQPLSNAMLDYGRCLVASQQLADRELVERLVDVPHSAVLLERKYLSERRAVPIRQVWTGGGDYEENRQCLFALLRSNIRVRLDDVGQALQHANFIVATEPKVSGSTSTQRVVITSANLAPGSISKHFNWLATIESRVFADRLTSIFHASMNGDFRNAEPNLAEFDFGISLAAGARGEVLRELDERLQRAHSSVDFAYFNISTSSPVVATLEEAAGRGVTVRGIVDGDQHGQNWDAVPRLRSAGVNALYYPGVMTGATGRMHYKMAVIDDEFVCLSTANISQSATESLEVGLFVDLNLVPDGDSVAQFVRNEIRRLEVNAVVG